MEGFFYFFALSDIVQAMKNKNILIALGGNALITDKQTGTYQEQLQSVKQTTVVLADLVAAGNKLVISHGNGPQVGNLLLQHAAAEGQVPALPMDICGAQSQGQIGYLLQQQLTNHFLARAIEEHVCTIVTQVEVDRDDPAFSHPSKPVGPFYSKAEAEERQSKGHVYIEDAGRGYRRVVPSPAPRKIVELRLIAELVKTGSVVIAAGGGGIPVVKSQKQLEGIEAVIDKDKTSALLAASLKVDVFVILTAVKQVALHFNTPQQKNLARITSEQAQQYATEGHFAPGSMLPKIEAAVSFVKQTGKDALITSADSLQAALAGSTGTWITKTK